MLISCIAIFLDIISFNFCVQNFFERYIHAKIKDSASTPFQSFKNIKVFPPSSFDWLGRVANIIFYVKCYVYR